MSVTNLDNSGHFQSLIEDGAQIVETNDSLGGRSVRPVKNGRSEFFGAMRTMWDRCCYVFYWHRRAEYFFHAHSKSKEPSPEDLALFQEYYKRAGVSQAFRYEKRYKTAQQYRPSKNEEAQIKQLRKHRKIIFDYANSIRNFLPIFSVAHLRSHIDRLSQSDAKDVVDMPGYTYFSLPGGSKGHAIMYEFVRKKGDETYSFLIHNTGEGANLHGKVTFSSNRKTYRQTTMEIAGLDKDVLQDKKFLKILCRLNKFKKIEDLYDLLYKFFDNYFNSGGRGHMYQHKDEADWLVEEEAASRTPDYDTTKKKSFEENFLKDPHFGAIQQCGSCVESCASRSEKLHFKLHFKAPEFKVLRQKLKGIELKYHYEMNKNSSDSIIQALNERAFQKLQKYADAAPTQDPLTVK
jgi:hypothetical protein